MAFTQLTSPIPVYVVGKGKALAFAVIDYGPEHNLIWVSAIEDTGEVWCVPNPKIRMQANWSLGRERSLKEEEERATLEIAPLADAWSQLKETEHSARSQ